MPNATVFSVRYIDARHAARVSQWLNDEGFETTPVSCTDFVANIAGRLGRGHVGEARRVTALIAEALGVELDDPERTRS